MSNSFLAPEIILWFSLILLIPSILKFFFNIFTLTCLLFLAMKNEYYLSYSNIFAGILLLFLLFTVVLSPITFIIFFT
jgi:hypothetical protein